MHTRQQLRDMSRHKLKTVERLMAAKEWEVSAYLMGYALECALKSAACKTLNLTTFPPLKDTARNKFADGFKTHDFKQLLVVSGLNGFFRVGSSHYAASQNWSDFTIEYPDNWTTMRYTDGTIKKFSEAKVKDLYKYLYDDSDSIIKTITGNRKW